ncbi:MAG: 7-cyano-7-deazaguanine synthase QueC [Omnitrophica WOR_2 bacterium RIFCSPHIGHO2_02_FULL_50_17]|nr:MAG: 7-cyano-7-deazaguanine synthase QueC [Omnitrophica WOR_2 bacterium RIFCSPHIGHO2_02_FULL_50_17]
MKKAVVLLSGGLDSATLLYYAKAQGFQAYCLILDYGQRHQVEIEHAQRIARQAGVPYKLVQLTFPWQGSSLLDRKMRLPRRKEINPQEIPSTYVPARNIIFLSLAASYAEAVGASAVFIGANAVDYSGYPDCRPEFFKAYQQALRKGTKAGVQKKAVKICAPFVRKTKAEIIKLGAGLKVPYHWTWSCYRGGKRPCGKCDSCLLRRRGFEAAGLPDPLV